MAGPIAFYAPDPIQSTQLIPGGNTPASGAQLFVYQVGTSTKQNSYTDASASTARTNPIILDSGGNIPGNGEVWIVSSAKFVLAPSNDTDPPSSPYWTRDNVPGINNVAAQIAAAATTEWVQGSTGTFVGVTAFSVVGDQTALYTLGRRVKIAVTGGDRYGIVTSQTLATGTTTIGVTLDSGTLNGGLSSVQYGLLSTPNGSIPWESQTSSGINYLGPISFLSVASNESETTVTSSANPNIWNGGNVINFTGTTTVSSFTNAPQAGSRRSLILGAAVSFVSSSVLTLGGTTSIYVGSVGDRIDVVATSVSTFIAYPVPIAPQVTAANGASLVFLASSAANNTSWVSFTSSITSTYDEYEFHLQRMRPVSTVANAMLRVSVNGTTWVSTAASTTFAYHWTGQGVGTDGTAFAQGSTLATDIRLSKNVGVVSTVDQSGMTQIVKLYQPSVTTAGMWKELTFSGRGVDNAGTVYHNVGSGMLTGLLASTNPIVGVQFLFESGNVSTGNFYLYALRKS